MTKAQALKILRSSDNAALYVSNGEVYLDDGEACRMISPSILCSLYRDGAGEIAPVDASNSIWQAIR